MSLHKYLCIRLKGLLHKAMALSRVGFEVFVVLIGFFVVYFFIFLRQGFSV